jgi:uncharacterized membrane protein YdjX (TVP38/TMEM64 family)
MRRIFPSVLVGLVLAAVAAGVWLRGSLPEAGSAEAIRDWVLALGWKGPAIYLALVTFRTFLFLPSWAVLAAGGLCFGIALGTLLGGTGILVSALYQFVIARAIGRAWVRPYLGERTLRAERRIQRVGALLVGFTTAHPIGPLTPFHLAAGLSAMPAVGFVVAVAVASPLRSLSWSVFGASLLDTGSPRFWITTALLVLVTLVPLAHPRVRGALFGRERGAALFPDVEDSR